MPPWSHKPRAVRCAGFDSLSRFNFFFMSRKKNITRDNKLRYILTEYSNGKINISQALRSINFITGFNKSSYCNLDRTIDTCEIIQKTSFKNCDGCGHFLN